MPKAAIDEHGKPAPRKDNIRPGALAVKVNSEILAEP
jgi:hypothetical protein